MFFAGVLLAVGGLVAVLVIKPCPRLKATMINDSLAEFEGASENFLNQIKTDTSKSK
jgi:hypothetical protein